MTFLLLTLCLLAAHQAMGDETDIGLNPGQMIANHGYPSETHLVTTEDGYILTLYRIPHGINDDGTTHKPPVLLMHGFGSCAGEFVALGPELGLSYILADAGYDVWLGNARGTVPSRNHTTIDADTNPELFFNFTWHEIGYYDVASYVDYILEVNGDDGLYYVGHSQGTTAFLVLTSMRPEYNSKFKLSSLMAPAAIVHHYSNQILQVVAKYVDDVWHLLQKYSIYEIPFTGSIRETIMILCKDYPNTVTDPICDWVFMNELSNIDQLFVPIVLSNCPSSAGLKQYVHYGQLVRDGGFKLWNYGPEQNLQIYGTETPPDYPLSQISAPIAFYYATSDGAVVPEDELDLVSRIPNVAINYLIPDETFGHIDFAMHWNVVELVYNKLLSVMSEY